MNPSKPSLFSPGNEGDARCLDQATQLRIAGNLEARSGNLAEAEKLYTEALALHVEGTVHLILANRSGVRLSRGDLTGALADADAAAQVAPPGFTTAYVRQVLPLPLL